MLIMKLIMDWRTKFAELSNIDINISYKTEKCSHIEIIEDTDYNVCAECGVVIGRKFLIEPHYSTTTVMRRTNTACPIYNDIPDEFDPTVKNLAVIIYKTATVKRIYKSTLRKAIIAACVYRAAIILNYSTRRCFSSMGLTTTEANRGILFISTYLPHGEYSIPLFGDKSEIAAACTISGIADQNINNVYNLFESFKTNCETVFASSQRVSIIYGCVWTFIKCFEDDISQFISRPECLSELINRLKNENSGNRAVVSAITIERKYYEIMKYILSRIMKRIFAICISYITQSSILRSITPKIPITVYNCKNPDTIRIVADDGFVYPIEDVDDVLDWHIIFDFKFTEFNSNKIIQLPIVVVSKSKSITINFNACQPVIRLIGYNILRDEIKHFIQA